MEPQVAMHSEGCLHYPPDCPDEVTCPFLGAHSLAEIAGMLEAERAAEAEAVAEDQREHPELTLPAQTMGELLQGDDESFDAVIPDLAYRGLKTLVVGQSKAGKSFMLWAKVAETLAAGKRVLYLSEEPSTTIRDKARTFGLVESEGLWVLRRGAGAVFNLQWFEVCARLEEDVRSVSVDLVVIDTARPWLALDGEESNAADRIGKLIDKLTPVCEAGAAVVVLHQAPWTAKRARGSTEWHAAVDLIFHVDGEGHSPRTVKYVGGRVDEVPEIQTFRWDGSQMQDLGKMRHDRANRLDEVLTALEKAGGPLTVEELAEGTDYNERSIRRWLGQLDDRGQVARIPGSAQQGHGKTPDRWERRHARFADLLDELD